MNYVGRIFRPPSEARSLLLQVTVGCSHNRCTYCDMYRDKSFKPKAWEQISADIEEAAAHGPVFDKVFLCDGDALILSMPKLLRILEAVRERLPWVRRVGTYGDTRSVGRKSAADLKALREAGLGIVYHGLETGDEEVMQRIDKGATRQECVDTAHKLRDAGIVHSVIVLLGIGGPDSSERHATETARLLTEMDPAFVGALTTTVVPGTPLAEAQNAGDFTLPDVWTMLAELRTLIADSRLTDCRFSSNHASNYVPLRGVLPRDRDAMLALLDPVLAERDESLLKPEWMRGL